MIYRHVAAEAQIFYSNHQAQCEKARELLLKATTEFIPVAAKVLDAKEPSRLVAAVESGNLPGILAVLRPLASRFHGASDRYWLLIDGLGFYLDGVGSYWRYLSEEGRARYIRWAQEHAQALLDHKPASAAA